MFFFFHGEALLAPRPTTKLEDHPSSAVCDCLFNIFAATLHIGGRSSIRNLRTRRAVVTGAHLTIYITYLFNTEAHSRNHFCHGKAITTLGYAARDEHIP